MKVVASLAACVATALALADCNDTPVQRVYVPGPNEQASYQAQMLPKPLPPNGYIPTAYPPGYQPPAFQPQPGQPGQPMGQPGQPVGMGGQPMAPQMLQFEPAFVDAYVARRSPKLMVFVNRTIQGDPLPPDQLNQVIVQDRQSATGAVNVSSNRNLAGVGQSTSVGYGGSAASNTNVSRNDSNSFIAGGPVEYTHTTTVQGPTQKTDAYGCTPEDYQMIEASLVRYFDNSGKVMIADSDAARAKLNREQVLRIENGDPAAARLLSTELQQDVLIRVTAVPTRQATNGQPSIRLIAKAVGTTDARMLATAFVDMPLPMGKTNINTYTGYLANELMGDMAKKWMQPAAMNPIEVRIYKAATVDDALKISDWLGTHDGVSSVRVNNATGGSATSYASLSVAYDGSSTELYSNLQKSIAASQGLKAVDITNNTISLEVTGTIQKQTLSTTRRSDTRPVTDTRTDAPRGPEVITTPASPIPPIPPQ